MTAADMRETTALHRSRKFSLVHAIAAVVLVLLGLQHWQNQKLDWLVGLYVAMAVYLVFSEVIFRWLFPVIFLRSMKYPLTFHISLDDQVILIQQNELRQEIQWSALVTTGTAREIENHFWLECGHVGVWIPKRAFPTADEMKTFRAFVKGIYGREMSVLRGTHTQRIARTISLSNNFIPCRSRWQARRSVRRSAFQRFLFSTPIPGVLWLDTALHSIGMTT
ncbi:MAG: YcxB family protein [Planctomycetia bacterium]|nr:YcxB family protein [Planctomycetia bacterium]